MRYFKYPYTNENENEASKAELAAFEEHQKKLVRKEKLFGILAMAVMFAAGIIAFALLNSLISLINFPIIKIIVLNIILAVLEALIKIACIFAAIILAGVAGLIASSPLWKIQESAAKELSKARRKHLRDIAQINIMNVQVFYGFGEPSIVTKCYESTVGQFTMKDIRIFERNGEVRIIKDFFSTVNLNEQDIGCYAFKKGEFKLVYTRYKGKPAAELTCGETTFILSLRAKFFIEKLAGYGENGIFITTENKKAGSSVYYEFAFRKKAPTRIKNISDVTSLPYIKNIPHINDLSLEKIAKADLTRFDKDSLLFHIDDSERFFINYLQYFKKPYSPDENGEFSCHGVNYYTAEQTEKILAEIEKNAPPYSAPLIEWLKKAKDHDGIFLFGI